MTYPHGFTTNLAPGMTLKGLSKDVIIKISQLRNEPEWLLTFRLEAYKKLLRMTLPTWGEIHYSIDLDNTIFFSEPNKKAKRLEDVDPKLLETYTKLGIPLLEQKRLAGVAIDAVFDSTSVITTYKKELAKQRSEERRVGKEC